MAFWSAAETPAANVTTYGRTGAGVEVGARVGSEASGGRTESAEGSEGGAVGSGGRWRGRRGFRRRLGGSDSGVAAGDGSGVGSGSGRLGRRSADGDDRAMRSDPPRQFQPSARTANETRRTIWKTMRNVRKRTERRELDIADKTSTAVTDTTKRHRV